MNRAICTNLDAGSAGVQALMPPERDGRRAPGEPVRVLFINGAEVGFATTARMLQHYTQRRDDIDAVHFSIVMPFWQRLLAAESRIAPLRASGLDLQAWRTMIAARTVLAGPLRRHLHPRRFDVVHIMTQQRGLVLPLLRRLSAAKIVINSDATMVQWDRDFGYPRRGPRPEIAAERRIFTAADAVACASEWVAGSVESDCGVSRERVFLHMPCARMLEGVSPRRPEAHIGRPGPLRLIFVGNAWKRKGGPRLLRWHQQRWTGRAELHVCSAEAPIDRSCRAVIWHGRTDHSRLMRELLPAADLFVLPTHEDTFLIAAQEAQALGLPVVSTRLAGIPEVVADGESGLLCARDDDAAYIAAVERLMDEPQFLSRLSAGAAAHAARRLNADVWHNHLLDQLVALADGRPVARAPGQAEAAVAGAL